MTARALGGGGAGGGGVGASQRATATMGQEEGVARRDGAGRGEEESELRGEERVARAGEGASGETESHACGGACAWEVCGRETECRHTKHQPSDLDE